MTMHIERAAVSARPEDIATKLRHAPAWVRNAANARAVGVTPDERPAWHYGSEAAPSRPAKPSKPQARSLPAVIGWLAGTCCPGVSKPCYGHTDGEHLPEQFTPRALESILAQVRTIKGDGVALTYGHGGPVLARAGDLDLTFRIDRIVGLEFEARLRDTAACRKVLNLMGMTGMGVSIGYTKARQWIVERDGAGRVRVVDDCVLDHVAVVEKDTNRRAAYVAARCYGSRGSGYGCPPELQRDARAWAFRYIALQAGCSRLKS